MAVMTDSTSRPEFELATNTALSDFPNMEAKREEQRSCLSDIVRENRAGAKHRGRRLTSTF